MAGDCRWKKAWVGAEAERGSGEMEAEGQQCRGREEEVEGAEGASEEERLTFECQTL